VGYPLAARFTADRLHGLGIDGGIDYSAESQRLAEAFAASRELKLNVVSIPQEYGEAIPAIAERTTRGRGKPCAICGLSKRHVMNPPRGMAVIRCW
jgi:tRNA(Ile)-lysidine synthase TilS/MesJ